MTLNSKNIDLTWFFGDFWLHDEMAGDRLRLPANRNCYKLFRASRELCSNYLYITRGHTHR